MRTHTTSTLRKLILHDMDISRHEMSAQEVSVWIQTLPQVAAEMFRHLDFLTGSIFDRGLVRRQVCQVQSECIYLLNAVDKMEDLAGEMGELKTEVTKCMEMILERLYTHCKKYLSEEVCLPRMYLKREQSGLNDQINLLLARMKQKGVDQVLQNIIMACFEGWKKAKQCTYSQRNYTVALLENLLQIVDKSDRQEASRKLSSHLFEVNFNTAAYIAFLQGKIREELAEIYVMKDQFERLYCYQREFEYTPYRKSAIRFDKDRRKNKEVMTDFINAELNYLRKQQQCDPVHPAAASLSLQASPSNTRIAAGYKIRFLLSVDALAYLIRLMVAAKMIDPGVRTELLSFVSQVFITPGSGNSGISAGSLGVKYKQVVQSTATKMRAALRKMLKQLDQDFAFD